MAGVDEVIQMLKENEIQQADVVFSKLAGEIMPQVFELIGEKRFVKLGGERLSHFEVV